MLYSREWAQRSLHNGVALVAPTQSRTGHDLPTSDTAAELVTARNQVFAIRHQTLTVTVDRGQVDGT